MESIKTKKVTLNGGMFLKVSFTEILPDMDEREHPNVSCTAPVHIDLAKAFQAFVPHLALIGEEISAEEFIDQMPGEYDATQPTIAEFGEVVPAIKAKKNAKAKGKQLEVITFEKPINLLTDMFILNTVEFKQVNGIAGVILTGQRRLSTGDYIGLGPTPIIKENNPHYKFLSQLFEDAELLKYEVGEYIINHKYAPPADPELPFGDGPADGEDSLFMNGGLDDIGLDL